VALQQGIYYFLDGLVMHTYYPSSHRVINIISREGTCNWERLINRSLLALSINKRKSKPNIRVRGLSHERIQLLV